MLGDVDDDEDEERKQEEVAVLFLLAYYAGCVLCEGGVALTCTREA